METLFIGMISVLGVSILALTLILTVTLIKHILSKKEGKSSEYTENGIDRLERMLELTEELIELRRDAGLCKCKDK